MTLAEQIASLIAHKNWDQLLSAPIPSLQPKKQSQRTETVYSVGEALNRKRLSDNAKLATGSVRDTG
jgi:hypothetical protein